ncbi:MAG: tetratricopeptide repeat protein [Methylobacter sp.]|nr:tetratricopeptide repeat protein [Methylobacter sp.]MDP2100705.1 tetratricopeptide repeat protein [Methylobacter sp.]MDP2428999.1 tetratricopeptide repeat protein [Methylobacter sp.]MDP3056500.1 tetratricopeptide repeat protein [Methylobacter sp.]MDP3363433.1 tetratricopeptide repeat protein [Methylobacter sp.]
MSFKRLVIIGALPSLLAGCAGIYGTQPPAPVYGGQPSPPKPPVSTTEKIPPAQPLVKTQPLKEFPEIKPEPWLSPEPLPIGPEPSEPVILAPLEPPPPPELTPFRPIEATVPLSPVVNALVLAANQNTKAGDIESAASSIERAIRIEPRNATLFYKLALLRLKQSKPRLAEDLAKKSALLAVNDNTLKKHCWLLIAHARELQQNFPGAKEAKMKADSF